MQRRSFLKATALAPAAVAIGAVPGLGADDAQPPADLADKLDATLFSSDGLAVPLPTGATPSPLADGLDRTLVLGGGGTYYLAWYCGFFHGLFEHGIDAPSLADMIVGTSAGSYAGSSKASGHFQRMSSPDEPQCFRYGAGQASRHLRGRHGRQEDRHSGQVKAFAPTAPLPASLQNRSCTPTRHRFFYGSR